MNTQQPKLTPEKLQQFRDEGIGTSSIVKMYSNLNPEFKQKYDAGVSRQFNVSGSDGKPLSWDDISLNMEAYGNPQGPTMQQPKQEGGVLNSIGNAATSIWDYATAPMDALSGAVAAPVAKAFNKDTNQIPDAKNLVSNAQQTADIAPIVGATIGSAAGPAGTGAGAFAGKAVGNLIESAIDVGTGKEQRRGVVSKLAGPVLQGAANAAGDKVFSSAVKYGLPVIKKTLTKAGAVLTNVSDDVLERAFNKPQIMSSAVKEISENVTQPFLKLSQQIGNTLKGKIDDAGKSIQTQKEFILANNPGASYNVSASTDEIARVLKEENLSLNLGSTGGKKSVVLLNQAGKAGTSPAAVNSSITGISQGKANPLSETEINKITDYIKTINKADDFSLEDVLDLKKLYNRLYNELGTNDIGTTSNAQRILRRVRETVDTKIAEAMPEELAKAYSDYSRAIGMHEDFGHFLTPNKQGKLELKDGAEKYLNTIGGMNRGQREENLKKLSDFLGIDIVGKMESLKDAQELSHLFPQTKGRSLDIIRALLAKGAVTAGTSAGAILGGGVGAGVGALGGAAVSTVTSPLVVGKMAMGAGKFAKNRIVNSFTTFMGKLAPAEREALLMFINGVSGKVDKASQNQ